MTKIRFPLRQVQGRLEPIISIGIKLGAGWKPIDVFVDSGATYTVLQAKLAERIGFDYLAGDPVSIQVGSGALIPVFLHELEVQLGTERFVCRVGFSDRMGIPFNILGKVGVFDRFDICFQQTKGFITFENATNSITED